MVSFLLVMSGNQTCQWKMPKDDVLQDVQDILNVMFDDTRGYESVATVATVAGSDPRG